MAMSCGGSADTPTAVACAKASLKLLEVLPGLTMEELFRRGFEGIDGANIESVPLLLVACLLSQTSLAESDFLWFAC